MQLLSNLDQVYDLGHKFACIFLPYNCQKSSLILELCLPFLNFAGWHLCIYMYVRC